MTGTSDLARLLTRYRAWADEFTYETAATLPLEEITKERQTTFKTIGHTLQHVHIVDEIFRAHLENRAHGYKRRTAETLPPIDELHRRASMMNKWWIDFADGLTDDGRSDPIAFEFVDGSPGLMTRLEIILHVVQHATYHRGYLDDMLYQVPVTPPATDLTVFLRNR